MDRKALELEIEVHYIALLSENSSAEMTTWSSVVTTNWERSVVIWEQSSALTGDGEDEEVKPILLVSFWGREGDSDVWSGSMPQSSTGSRRMVVSILSILLVAIHPSYGRCPARPLLLLCFSKPDILPYADMNRNIRAFFRTPSVSCNVSPKDNTRTFVPWLIALLSPKNDIFGVVFDGSLVLGQMVRTVRLQHSFPVNAFSRWTI